MKLLAVAAVLCAGWLLGAPPVHAASGPPPAPAAAAAPTLTLTAKTLSGTPDRVVLTAHLSAAGAPVAGATVAFSQTVTQFSAAPQMAITTATTDDDGLATVADTPMFTGVLRYTAEYAPRGGRPVDAQTQTEVDVAATAPDPVVVPPLEGEGRVLVAVLGVTVAAVWVLLLGLVVHVVRALPRHTGRASITTTPTDAR